MTQAGSLVIHEQDTGTWSNPEHLLWIVSQVRKYAVLSQLAWVSMDNEPVLQGHHTLFASYDDSEPMHQGIPRQVTAAQVERANADKVLNLAESMRDPYLCHGIPELYNSWDEFSNYLMTPPMMRSSIRAHRDKMLAGSIGAGCLLAHTIGQTFELELNGYSFAVNPDTMPADTMAQYMTAIKSAS